MADERTSWAKCGVGSARMKEFDVEEMWLRFMRFASDGSCSSDDVGRSWIGILKTAVIVSESYVCHEQNE